VKADLVAAPDAVWMVTDPPEQIRCSRSRSVSPQPIIAHYRLAANRGDKNPRKAKGSADEPCHAHAERFANSNAGAYQKN
jgi:hypothetical protein